MGEKMRSLVTRPFDKSTKRSHLQVQPFAHIKEVPVALLGLTLLAATMSACGGAAPAEPAAPPPPPPPPPAEHVPPPPVEEEPEPEVKIISDAGFETPESVYYDEKRDVYLVSNINGGSHDADGNGFISKITPDGDVTVKFIDGAGKKITLHAPKGMTVDGDTLYVADINHIRMFDAQSGLSKGEIKVKGASMLNDIATGPDGLLYVSDSGVNDRWETNGKDAVFTVKDGKVKKLHAHKEKLGNPNGVLAGKGGVWVVTGVTGELIWIGDNGKLGDVQKVSEGGNDGVVVAKDGRLLVSSWAESAVYAGKPGGEFTKEISGVDAPADIGYDCTRNRVLIPLFKENKVVIHTLSKAAPAQEAAE